MLGIQHSKHWGAYLSPMSTWLSLAPVRGRADTGRMTCHGAAQGLDLSMENIGSETLAPTFETWGGKKNDRVCVVNKERWEQTYYVQILT